MKKNVKTIITKPIITLCIVLSCLGAACVFFKSAKAPMIVVQGSMQLWPVTIQNNSGRTLRVTDELIYPRDNKGMSRYLSSVVPNNQFTFQWPSTFEHPNARKITIVGIDTDPVIIGNTPDSNYPMLASGDFSIIGGGYRTEIRNGQPVRVLILCVASKTNPKLCR